MARRNADDIANQLLTEKSYMIRKLAIQADGLRNENQQLRAEVARLKELLEGCRKTMEHFGINYKSLLEWMADSEEE